MIDFLSYLHVFHLGDGKVEAGTLKTIAAHLLLEENGKAQGSIDDELPVGVIDYR